ncbi:ribosome small subunit-dependent GTPase A [Anaeromassilibacillus senegalensis]|uniref:ribosome small subunit-dependent GTPase A n=1 Tax=Anaeromassilibacillus senegalensis TaxID=1673717 RepID=UPI0009E2EF45|nr:ribosome small subunit-dependent GTPase A [Anaeromassilibacillus senegalensis]
MHIKKYGFHPITSMEYKNGIPARITAVHRDRFEMICDHGSGFARLKAGEYHAGKEEIPTTGDFVLLDWQEHGESRILKTLPRKTYFSRRDPSASGYKEQAVAANFDYVFIMQSLDQNFNPRRLERYLTLAWQSGAVPAVILTKADCVEDYLPQLRTAERLAVGVGVFAVSSKTGFGLDQLSEYMKPGKTIVFLGSSGVGKSSLVNALAGQEKMETGDIREKDGRGRHTTTCRQLLLLDSGVMIIDTPGMRELGMWDVSDGLEQSFTDVEQYLGQCKFSDCRHQGEPGCAVAAAIQRGELSLERWESYQRLHQEACYAEDKAGYLRKKQQWGKNIAKLQKQLQKADYRHMPCTESFTCKVCGALVVPEAAGSQHRNHCPRCLSSVHVDNQPGDRASLCKGVMEPVGVWVRKNGEWAIIHRCRSCGTFSSNRIAADDNPTLLMSIAMKPLAAPPFPLWQMEREKE